MKSIMLDDNRVEDYYYKNPWRYRFSRNYAFQQIIDSFKKVVANRPSNSNPLKILEIGCGSGWFSININKNNDFHFTAIDVSREAINNAKIYATQNNITHNEYICSALETFDSREIYDFVVCVNSLHHFRDLQQFCDKVSEYLSDDGFLFVYDVCPDRFNMDNASYVLLIELILSLTNNFYKAEKSPMSSSSTTIDIELRLNRILFEWQNETDDLKQSAHDHFHDTETILASLRKNFKEQSYSESGGILTRLLGGIRGNSPSVIGEALIKAESIFLREKLIAPYNYCFLGSKR